MKVHYFNILLFALPLNILVGSPQKNPSITQKRPTTRLLCECELYSPTNYDSDPEMKRVMQQFVDRTTQRFHEYDERMKTTRQKCREQCDKEIQKIILKDKLEKELMEKFATLQTDIQNDAIPTCVCEKSLADKTEKFCLNCGVNVGGGVTLSSGVLGGIGAVAVNAWKDAALEAAIAAAKEAGAVAGKAAGKARGMEVVLHYLEEFGVDKLVPDICKKVSSTGDYTHVINFTKTIIEKRHTMCGVDGRTLGDATCKQINIGLGTRLRDGSAGLPDNLAVPKVLNRLVGEATQAADATAKIATEDAIAKITTEQTTAINTIFMGKQTTIIASIVAILVIVLIMVIIYLILRYRRKKKMKKKLQYIKLLKE
ncbi:hypothetical protein PFHG_04051 [Plasmodium falciparum HB3]|uniref:Rifin n=1 Tax=Plasmodium falciparum (isolate HB3) TaxID=137071 RepID=A0A0L7KHE7_PLAFX|nr:hypothetical protein PFHG_04051 [Plasmodium falciparum HB3]